MVKQLSYLFIFLIPSLLYGQDHVKNIDTYMEQAIKDWNIPGAAICIVKGDEVLLSKGYGLLDSEKKARANGGSLFAIASNTKAFTSAAIAQLVEQEKLKWNDKVRDYLPYFKMYDNYVSEEMIVSDLLCHRSGLATFSGDLVWYGTTYSPEEIIRRAQYLEPTSSFRTEYGYQNIMFIAAGLVIEAASGMPWEEYIRKNFLEPLEMDRTVLSIRDLEKMENVCAPHNEVDGKNMPIDWINWDNIGAAGSIISCTDDLSKWMRMQLNKGEWKGKKYFEENSSNIMWTAHTPKKLSNFHRSNFPSKHFSAYGLGWDLFDYHGNLVANHGGGYDGFISHTVLIPEQKLGFVILTNNISYFPYAMQYNFLEEFLNEGEKKDFGKQFLEYKVADEEEKLKNEETLNAARIKDSRPSLSIDNYTGTYHSEMYGDVVLEAEGNELKFQFIPTELFNGKLTHWHFDTFRLHWGAQQMLPKGMVNFILNAKGEVIEMKVDVPNPDFDFTELELMKVLEE